ncbi:MAG TPA: orotate phosphoribosyltransferase [Planctomycetota bacterium]|nr:orotate phosphoribosyltransferase [Planctomycetota bacterium]
MTSSAPAMLDVEQRLVRANALLKGHFQLTSGRHSDRYVQCALLLALPREAEAVCAALGDRLADCKPDLVVGPALGGVIVAHEVARRLGTPSFFAERKDGVMSLRRGFSIKPGQRIVVVEDVVTTGGSVKEVVSILRAAGGNVVGLGSLVCRSATSPFDMRYEALLKLPIESWEADQCPLCKAGGTAIKPGSRPGA